MCFRTHLTPINWRQNWRKPDCGIATYRIRYHQVPYSVVRIGGSPIVGLQPHRNAARRSTDGVRIGGSPIVGLQHERCKAHCNGTCMSELAEARLWDCNTAYGRPLDYGRFVRIGGSLIVGLQPKLYSVEHLTHPQSQNWRKPDCGIATLLFHHYNSFTIFVRIGGSPIVGLQLLCAQAKPSLRASSELAEARLWDCNQLQRNGA